MQKPVPAPINTERLDPAAREAARISAATQVDEASSEDITIIDTKVAAQEAMRAQDRIFKETQEQGKVDVFTERTATPLTTLVRAPRNRARVLLVLRDSEVMNPASAIRRRIFELEHMFAEVHVLLVTIGKNVPDILTAPRRLSDTVWLYSAHTRFRFGIVGEARRVASAQLMFGNGFRADLIVALDPFESGLIARAFAKEFDRPLQIHVSEDFFARSFIHGGNGNRWRSRTAHTILRNASCVRTTSSYLKGRLIETFRSLRGKVEILPTYYDIEGWKKTPAIIDLVKKYPQFKFVIVHPVYAHEEAHTAAVIDGLFYVLRQYPTIGLVLCGDAGVLRAHAERVVAYHLEAQIMFEPGSNDVLSYIKTASALVYTSEEPAHSDALLVAAASGVPIVSGNVGLATELFIDEESVLLCPIDSPPCFGEKINRLLNDNPLRGRLAINARDIVDTEIEQDYDTYLAAYRASIEGCLI